MQQFKYKNYAYLFLLAFFLNFLKTLNLIAVIANRQSLSIVETESNRTQVISTDEPLFVREREQADFLPINPATGTAKYIPQKNGYLLKLAGSI